MNTTTLTSPTTEIVMSASQWASRFEFEAFEEPTAALNAAREAKLNAEFGADEENKVRLFEDTLLVLVATRAAREGFNDEQIAAITTDLATRRHHYGYHETA